MELRHDIISWGGASKMSKQLVTDLETEVDNLIWLISISTISNDVSSDIAESRRKIEKLEKEIDNLNGVEPVKTEI